MRQILLALGLGLSLTTAWAQDEVAEAAPAATATETPLQPAEPPPVDLPAATPVAGMSVPPVQTEEESDQKKLVDLHRKLVAQKLELFRTTIKNTETKKNLFSRLLTSSQNPIDGELLAEMRRFTESHPELPETAEVYLLMAQVHQRIGEYPAAAIDLLLLRAAYPDSPFDKDAAKRLQALAGEDLKKHAEMLKTTGAKIAGLKGQREERVVGLLRLLGENTEKDMARPIADACAAFLAGNQGWLQEDLVQHAWARQVALLDAQTAVYHYDKLLALYPGSALRADSLLGKASIQRKSMQAYPQAAATYNQLIAQFPDSPETKQAYEALATMYDAEMQDYPNAIKTCEAIVARYKDDPMVLRTLRLMAGIQQNKTNQPAQAIESHLKIADLFKGNEGLEALLAAERLALFTTRDWAKAIDINHRIMAFLPGHEEAVKAEFKNAEITEEKLGDKTAARALYAVFLDKHPRHELARDATRRIEAIDKASSSATR
jgi:tetratricopeptide (TPR) repeat protein